MAVQGKLTEQSYIQGLYYYRPEDDSYVKVSLNTPLQSLDGEPYKEAVLDPTYIHEEEWERGFDRLYVAVQANEKDIIAACQASGGSYTYLDCHCPEGFSPEPFETCVPLPARELLPEDWVW